MDFKKATDELQAVPTHQEIAEALGVSVPTVRQARLDARAKARRTPPEGWETVVARLAEARGRRLLRLAAQLKGRNP